MLAGRRVVLGVSGGIASYKACAIARRLTEDGAAVDVVMTASAAEFIGPVTFEALTGRPVVTSLWDRGRALDHVRLGREADLIIVAPATAQLIARMAQGLADDFLSTLLVARRAPVLLCPAMNDAMWAHDATQANTALILRRGNDGADDAGRVHVLGPDTGPLARGEGEGPGRMVEPEVILEHAARLLRKGPLAGRAVVVTAGPTREPIDPVRVLTNRSSGRMGYALARAAWLAGADVTLITGPTTLIPPVGCTVRRIETTEDLQAAVSAVLPAADVLLMAAAPADYRPSSAGATKMVREAGPVKITLEPTADVLGSTAYWRKGGALMVGFALETGDPVPRAQEKMLKKQLDMIIANDATEPGAGPDVTTNRVTIISRGKTEALPLLSKDEVAERIIAKVAEEMSRRPEPQVVGAGLPRIPE